MRPASVPRLASKGAVQGDDLEEGTTCKIASAFFGGEIG